MQTWLLILTILGSDGSIQQVTPITEYPTYALCQDEGGALAGSTNKRLMDIKEHFKVDGVVKSLAAFDCIKTGLEAEAPVADSALPSTTTLNLMLRNAAPESEPEGTAQ